MLLQLAPSTKAHDCLDPKISEKREASRLTAAESGI